MANTRKISALKKIKHLAYPFRNTPFHPQWFSYRHNNDIHSGITGNSSGLVLDIGCGTGIHKKFLGKECSYYGLDLPFTSINWYGTRPDVYGTADALPFRDCCVSTVLLLDVLEHLKSPNNCLNEINRTLSPGGILIVKIPFIYPIHDAPLDYNRWTEHGLLHLFNEHKFEVIDVRKYGLPLETAALMLCIAISKHTVNWFTRKNPLFILGLMLCTIIPVINLGAWVLGRAGKKDYMMPHTYSCILKKTKNNR